MNKISFLLLVTSICCVFQVQASNKKSIENCEKKSKSVVELSQCLDEVVDAIDKELQTWINNQTFILDELVSSTGRKSVLSMFKRSERNFISYRENNCRWQYLAISPASGAGAAYKKCYILLSQNRINELSSINP